VELRRARTGEARSLARLWVRSRAAAVPSIPPSIHADDEVEQWFDDVILPTCDVWVAAESSGEAVALMVLDREWIDQLYVDPEWTGKGIGTALLEHAKRLHPSELRLWTFQSNVGARRFYEAHGFVGGATTSGDNEEQKPDVCYEWRLA
jgi:GNAT superfamily N-acetyltransferase